MLWEGGNKGGIRDIGEIFGQGGHTGHEFLCRNTSSMNDIGVMRDGDTFKQVLIAGRPDSITYEWEGSTPRDTFEVIMTRHVHNKPLLMICNIHESFKWNYIPDFSNVLTISQDMQDILLKGITHITHWVWDNFPIEQQFLRGDPIMPDQP